MRAVVVLGCRVRLDEEGRLARGALRRRVERAALLAAPREAAVPGPGAGAGEVLFIASGGRQWDGQVEADAMARELERLGIPAGAIARERLSMTTRENARFVAEALARRGTNRATVVTCEWHLARALLLFGKAGLEVDGVASTEPGAMSWGRRAWLRGRESALAWVQSR